MKYFFNGAFYDEKITPEIPTGAVEISDDCWRGLLEAQAAGKRIVPGADGAPVAADPPEPSLDERKAEAVAELWANFKAHQQQYVDAEDLTLATVCAASGSAKGAAVQGWVMNLWANYYQVKDAIEAAADADALDAIDLAPDPQDVPPYTIRELNEEAAAAMAAQHNNQEDTP